jgi:hypothetical protein
MAALESTSNQRKGNMANKIFRDRLDANIQRCLMEFRNSAALEHPGLVGTVRQLFIDDLLTPLMPEGIRIGTGKITDSKGQLSAETDIVIYDRRSVPPLMYDPKLGVFPIESVYYAIEVKSKLTSREFESSIEKGMKLRTLSGPQPHSALFAFNSDLTANTDSVRFVQGQQHIQAPLPINVFCVAGREYGFWDKVWNLFPADKQQNEIVSMLVGIANTLVQAAQLRRPTLEPGYYFFDGPADGNGLT